MIDGIRGVSTNTARVSEPKASQATSRALVVTPVAPTSRSTANVRQPAAFLTHLLAVRDQVPHLRQRRRAAPEDAIAAYATAMQQHLPAGHFVSKQV